MTDLLTPAQIDPRNRFGAASPGAPNVMVTAAEPPGSEGRRRSRWRWLALVVAAIVLAGGGYFAGRLTAPSPGPTVVTVTHGLVAGAPVTAADLSLTHVKAAPVGAMKTLTAAAGETALRAVPAGAVLLTSDVGPAAAYPKPGTVLVGVSVKPGQAPAEALQPGDFVVAVEPPPSSATSARTTTRPIVLTGAVQVVSVQQVSGSESVTLAVPAALSTALGAQAGAGNVTLLQVPAPAAP